jgi:mannose-6-phosphate isomerase-like protein (cupin superfamily)
MNKPRKLVWGVRDAPMVESADGGMRDSVMVTDETCGARDISAGLVWVKPGFEIHEDTHSFDEIYFVVSGRAQLILADEPHDMRAGELVYIPNGIRHKILNPHDEPFQIAWILATKWSNLPDVKAELATWPKVDPNTGWHTT